ncbi:kinesin-like protein KIN-4A [Tanacetum coccineum]|uniref:Kinesin-like protein KIN-4A n=1 Tax=Tanacetum coccineum TaxID=301880 RepID=A0ABQ5GW04_9ASTR
MDKDVPTLRPDTNLDHMQLVNIGNQRSSLEDDAEQKVKQEEEQFRQWKANHEKQLMRVKKDSRKNEFEMNKLNALYQRRTQVLERKTEEAARATKKLKELFESRKAISTTTTKSIRNWLSQEVEKVVNVHKLRFGREKKTPSRRRNGCQKMLQSRNTMIAAQLIGLCRSNILCSGVPVSGMTMKM